MDASRRRFLSLGFVVALAGCASTETVKQSEGQGANRIYEHGFEPVFDAALAAAKSRKLEVVESDRTSGKLVLSHGVTLWSWGERIALFVRPVAPQRTRVEIVSRPVLAPLNFPPDWDRILLEEIDSRLRGGG